jgi:predicted porin
MLGLEAENNLNNDLIIFLVWETFFSSNTRQNREWTETSTHQNEIELAMFGE